MKRISGRIWRAFERRWTWIARLFWRKLKQRWNKMPFHHCKTVPCALLLNGVFLIKKPLSFLLLTAWTFSNYRSLLQFGGPDGELGASLRYLSQRFSMPYPELKGLLTDIGTEELGHLEMVGTIVHQLTRNLSEEQIKMAGFDTYFVDHTTGVYPQFASGTPWTAATMQVTGDTIADLTEDLAADGAMV